MNFFAYDKTINHLSFLEDVINGLNICIARHQLFAGNEAICQIFWQSGTSDFCCRSKMIVRYAMECKGLCIWFKNSKTRFRVSVAWLSERADNTNPLAMLQDWNFIARMRRKAN